MDGPVSGVQRMEHVCGGTDSGQNTGGNAGIGNHSAAGRKPVHLMEISTGKEERIPTGIGELDRVLGGGIVPGS